MTENIQEIGKLITSNYTGKAVDKYGTIYFLKDGKYHNENGPAITYIDGQVEYFINGLRHREGGPAIIYASLKEEYWRNGLLDCPDGPALGKYGYYFQGVKHTFIIAPWSEYYLKLKLKIFI